MIELAVIEDNRLLIDGLCAWAGTVPDIYLTAVSATVDGFLRELPGRHDVVVLLNPCCAPILILRSMCAG